MKYMFVYVVSYWGVRFSDDDHYDQFDRGTTGSSRWQIFSSMSINTNQE